MPFLPFLFTLLINIGLTIATSVIRAAIGGPPPVHGQQLKNKAISSSTYGQPWPRCRGAVRLNGNMLWATKIRETTHKTSRGGIFGLGQQAVYTYTYSVTCAVGFGKKLGGGDLAGGGPAVKFVRIYADGKRLYDAQVTDASLTGSVTLGAATQGDQSIQIHVGNGSTLKLSIGDFITFAATPNQEYEVQSPLNLGPNSTGTIGIFPFATQDYTGGGQINIPGLTQPLLNVSSFDPDPHDGSHLNGGYIPGQGGITFYLGSDTQNPDPHIIAKLGAGNVPGYRGLCYCVIYDLQLANYGNRLPNISAELLFDNTLFLSDVVAGLLKEAGYTPSQYDVSALSNTPIQGVEYDQQTYQDSLHQLMGVYLFDSAEVDGQIIFKFRDGLPVMEIPEDDLGALGDMTSQEPRIEESLQDEQSVPATVWIRYYDSLKQFQQASQYDKRISEPFGGGTPVTNSKVQLTLDVPITEIGQTMKQQAQKILFDFWSSRLTAKFKLPYKYIQLDPTDVVEIPYKDDFVVVRLTQVDRGASWPLELQGIAHEFHHSVALSDSGDGSGGTPVLPPDTPPDSVLTLLDMPFLENADAHNTDEDTGLYFALSTSVNTALHIDPLLAQWHGGSVYRSTDNVNFDAVGKADIAAFRGVASNLLPAPTNPWVFDDSNSLTVTWSGYDPTTATGPSERPISASDSLVTNGHANVGALIKANGEMELLQFGNVVDHADGTFTFSHLVRGIRGTETMARGHSVGDVFVVLTGASQHIDVPVGDRGLTRYYKAISNGQAPGSGTSQAEITVPRDLMPYAPYQIRGYIDDHSNIVISWTRRTRLGGNWVDGTAGPLSEQFEEYQVDVYDALGTTVLRTITVPLATTIYTKADQVADFGHIVNSVIVHIFQVSAIVGRGFPGIGQAPAPGAPPNWGNDPYVITFDLGEDIKPKSNQKLLKHIIAGNVSGVIFPIGMNDSVAGCRVAPSADYHVAVNWQGIQVATLTYLAGQTEGHFFLSVIGPVELDFSVASGELLEFIAPSGEDASIEGLYWTVSGKRYTQQKASIGNNFLF